MPRVVLKLVRISSNPTWELHSRTTPFTPIIVAHCKLDTPQYVLGYCPMYYDSGHCRIFLAHNIMCSNLRIWNLCFLHEHELLWVENILSIPYQEYEKPIVNITSYII